MSATTVPSAVITHPVTNATSVSANAGRNERVYGRVPVRGRGNVRRGRRRRKRRRLTDAEKQSAEQQREYLEGNRITGDYTRNLQIRVMDVVEYLQNNGGDRFLRGVIPGQQEDGWELDKKL